MEERGMGSTPAEAIGILIFLSGFTSLAAAFALGGVLYYVLAVALVPVSFFTLHKYRQVDVEG
jgi:hypothetical protein